MKTSVALHHIKLAPVSGERVVSNLARFVMLILTQSYTASLASLLTVQQLQPTVSDIKDVLRNRDNVGFAENTYINELLKQVGFDDSKIKMFRSFEECDELLSKGSANGGIVAAAFPKLSPLIPDLSQAVLNVTQGEVIMNIENKWYSVEKNCVDNSNPRVASYSLGLASFWGLFLIAGVASILALIICAASFLHKHRHILMHPDDSRASGWRRIRAMFKMFNEKELSSCMFKSPQHRDGIAGAGGEVNAAASPNNNWPESQGSYISNHADFAEQATPSNGQVSPEIVSAVNHEYHNCKNLLKQLNNTSLLGKVALYITSLKKKRVSCLACGGSPANAERRKRVTAKNRKEQIQGFDDFKLKVREGRRPGIAYDAENCEANSAEVMLIVQITSDFERLAQAFSAGATASSPFLPLTALVIQDRLQD
ncbi:unnamed protein product [Prunus armeniaca]|uniref:Ionotropic glutamate receptor C-terminal domain-containing protein n=1 Tax=Prunus armeniaca TaxID=36596 RepID=A0A6J5TJJ3_PRUAR|nr:unnamed protein product [Prunus armeniaca]CAB4294719.1 unnamed protein product [Prunus armeniaca]